MSLDAVNERIKSLKNADNSAETLERTLAHLKNNDVTINGKDQIRLGLSLEMDPKAETFLSNDEANAMLTRQYREPFVVPARA